MFGAPELKQKGKHAWKLLWTYTKKGTNENFRKKARCVVDGSPRGRQNIKVRHTFASSLAQEGERILWALAAQQGMIAIGTDVLSAFAEAKMSEESKFYILVDDNFRDWWVNHKKRPPIPEGNYVCKVNYALQGHPEAPRLWERQVHSILTNKLFFKAPTHEPCLYQATIKDSYVLLLCQIDDFAITVEYETLPHYIIKEIDKHLRIQIKSLGIITMCNSMDAIQS
jgi:hypothetical protein